jgi:hypothetical protein
MTDAADIVIASSKKSDAEKLSRATAALAAAAKEKSELEAELMEARAAKKDAEDKTAALEEAHRRTVESIRSADDSVIGVRAVAKVRIRGASCASFDKDGNPTSPVRQFDVALPGAVLGFDPKNPPSGFEGLVEGEHYEYR